jgi:hypothetical protein
LLEVGLGDQRFAPIAWSSLLSPANWEFQNNSNLPLPTPLVFYSYNSSGSCRPEAKHERDIEL